MKRVILVLLFMAIIHVACNNKNNHQVICDNVEIKSTESIIKDTSKKIVDTPLVYSVKSIHCFSDNIKKDTFLISLFGKKFDDAFVIFQIKNSENKTIHNERITSQNFISGEDYEGNMYKNIDTIKAMMNKFFVSKNFYRPASLVDTSNLNIIDDKEILSEIKEDKSIIGFFYLYGYESSSAIYYSKKQKKVLEYFACD